jgi:hypothetical protein
MICPYCQHDLDVESLSCPRCGAEYPRPGMPFGMGLRTTLAASAMMVVFSLVLVDCVLNYLPGGVNSTMPIGSSQLPSQTPPTVKSIDAQQQLDRWAQGQQNTAFAQPQPIKKQ